MLPPDVEPTPSRYTLWLRELSLDEALRERAEAVIRFWERYVGDLNPGQTPWFVANVLFAHRVAVLVTLGAHACEPLSRHALEERITLSVADDALRHAFLGMERKLAALKYRADLGDSSAAVTATIDGQKQRIVVTGPYVEARRTRRDLYWLGIQFEPLPRGTCRSTTVAVDGWPDLQLSGFGIVFSAGTHRTFNVMRDEETTTARVEAETEVWKQLIATAQAALVSLTGVRATRCRDEAHEDYLFDCSSDCVLLSSRDDSIDGWIEEEFLGEQLARYRVSCGFVAHDVAVDAVESLLAAPKGPLREVTFAYSADFTSVTSGHSYNAAEQLRRSLESKLASRFLIEHVDFRGTTVRVTPTLTVAFRTSFAASLETNVLILLLRLRSSNPAPIDDICAFDMNDFLSWLLA